METNNKFLRKFECETCHKEIQSESLWTDKHRKVFCCTEFFFKFYGGISVKRDTKKFNELFEERVGYFHPDRKPTVNIDGDLWNENGRIVKFRYSDSCIKIIGVYNKDREQIPYKGKIYLRESCFGLCIWTSDDFELDNEVVSIRFYEIERKETNDGRD